MHRLVSSLLLALLATICSACATSSGRPRWLAGDHHVHSIYSATYRADPAQPHRSPKPVIGGDSAHTILQNAQMARRFGLDWMVSTDHGGPGHSSLNYELAWPDVVAARRAVPGLILFYGAEFDVPGGEHASLIMPMDANERANLRDIEAHFGKREAFPADPARNTKARMADALKFMQALPVPPVLLANHPSRTATGREKWGLHAPSEFMAWHDLAPSVAIGMEGAPGHQAARPENGKDMAHGSRGLYGGYPTLGGFDQMVAVRGGAWDRMLGTGLRWSITASSDSHGHWSERGADFWPGEYTKTWVHATPNAAAILDGLRHGRVFVATGNLIEGLEFRAATMDYPKGTASMGDTLRTADGGSVVVSIRVRTAKAPNSNGLIPELDHIDIICGTAVSASDVDGGAQTTGNATVIARLDRKQLKAAYRSLAAQVRITLPKNAKYIRLRGSSTRQDEPSPDTPGEDPWADLWFYSNPIYIESRKQSPH